ncbi:hypothetical protein [Parendozoicomonas haliclonae]|nr:hypothetical protein [Parendozoicomonas haliclonae]
MTTRNASNKDGKGTARASVVENAQTNLSRSTSGQFVPERHDRSLFYRRIGFPADSQHRRIEAALRGGILQWDTLEDLQSQMYQQHSQGNNSPSPAVKKQFFTEALQEALGQNFWERLVLDTPLQSIQLAGKTPESKEQPKEQSQEEPVRSDSRLKRAGTPAARRKNTVDTELVLQGALRLVSEQAPGFSTYHKQNTPQALRMVMSFLGWHLSELRELLQPNQGRENNGGAQLLHWIYAAVNNGRMTIEEGRHYWKQCDKNPWCLYLLQHKNIAWRVVSESRQNGAPPLGCLYPANLADLFNCFCHQANLVTSFMGQLKVECTAPLLACLQINGPVIASELYQQHVVNRLTPLMYKFLLSRSEKQLLQYCQNRSLFETAYQNWCTLNQGVAYQSFQGSLISQRSQTSLSSYSSQLPEWESGTVV